LLKLLRSFPSLCVKGRNLPWLGDGWGQMEQF
jgi:hypothetical protein